MADPFIGEIRIFGFNFAPAGWAFCAGQLLPISQNAALFSILGTMYGGNGTVNFALPNLLSRVPIHQGQGPGLTTRIQGETGGAETVTLEVAQIPAHSHSAVGNNANANAYGPSSNFWAKGVPNTNPANTTRNYHESGPGSMSAVAIAPAGGSQPHNNLQPTLSLNYCIALTGVFPPRS